MSQPLSNFRGDSIYLDTMICCTNIVSLDSDFDQVLGIQRYVFEP